ncbi:hypothetical protein [Pseudomonas sp. R5(2019)]|uniref:hypothetical protein n=1 Tax=Pseudomonas sp. R5(2019) TaxID=2697566 RepID=UPI001412309A|nr:hypothetical protein [Pseudomonas sp. R5(2019)]NBA98180.1 hypothetical protein [Pseudomonas sp. R5(2019)]
MNMEAERRHRGWLWAYRKIRGLDCSVITAFYRATLFVWRGDTGSFTSDRSWQKIRIKR